MSSLPVRSRLGMAAVALGAALSGLPSQAAVVLTGTLRDFCAPSTTECTRLTDFEGATPGVVTGMVGSTLVGGLPVAGANINAGGSSAANFAQWFVNTPGVNKAGSLTMNLGQNASGAYTYSNNSFFPLDGLGYGNQGRSHNYHFTLHLEGQLAFSDPTAGADQQFTFSGDDDLWVFVNGQLVLDLGGVHSSVTGSFDEEDLKALGMAAGTAYDLDIFFAERHTTESNFAITTTLDIRSTTPVPEPGSLLLAAAALGALRAASRQRNRR